MAPTNHIRPPSEPEWEKWKPTFKHLYIDQDKSLPVVMKEMETRHGFKASQKMYKNRIKGWNMTKYLKADEAERIANTGDSSDERTHVAQRSVMRRKSRQATKQRARNESSASEHPPTSATLSTSPPPPQQPIHLMTAQIPPPQLHAITTNSFVTEPSPILTSPQHGQTWTPPPEPPFRLGSFSATNTITDQFLFNLRAWTHEAFVEHHWDSDAADLHSKARHVSRRFASELSAGMKLYEQNKDSLAWAHWQRATKHFSNPDLFRTWYHETPVRLLFETARIAQTGHTDFAKTLLGMIQDWANTHLERSDKRHALYDLYGHLNVNELRGLHTRAAQCLIDSMLSYLSGRDPLLFEVRLNRAIDMIWFDEKADLTKWLPPLEEVDDACGVHNVFSIYYLLLQAYQSVAIGYYNDAEDKCALAKARIDAMPPGSVDDWRLGMAYRRLGRIQTQRQRYQDAKRSLNIALRYVGKGKDANAIMVEVCQCQESMARTLGDELEVAFWARMVETHAENERLRQQIEDGPTIPNGVQSVAAEDVLSPSGLSRQGTFDR